jgi:hypothetical protein
VNRRGIEIAAIGRRHKMKRFLVLFLALLLTGLIGCDGDGGGDAATSEETPTEPGDTGPETITLDSGTGDVLSGGSQLTLYVTVTEPGTLETRVTWSGQPDLMSARTVQAGVLDLTELGSSPLNLSLGVTQYMVDQGGNFSIELSHLGIDHVQVEYRIRFTPDN